QAPQGARTAAARAFRSLSADDRAVPGEGAAGPLSERHGSAARARECLPDVESRGGSDMTSAPQLTILRAPTPEDWVLAAVERWRELLVDHANCEKKAASTALALMFAYPEDHALAMALSRLAREELRHFEQVQKMMLTLGVDFERQQPGRYASGLRGLLST